MILVGNSSAGMVIACVAERVPGRIARLVYLDAFVPADGQCLLDLVPADRRRAMEALVESEGEGWLLPRFAAAPWPEFIPRVWQVTDEADLAWMLARLRPTPFGQFTTPIQVTDPAAARLPRTYVRCTAWPASGLRSHDRARGPHGGLAAVHARRLASGLHHQPGRGRQRAARPDRDGLRRGKRQEPPPMIAQVVDLGFRRWRCLSLTRTPGNAAELHISRCGRDGPSRSGRAARWRPRPGW